MGEPDEKLPLATRDSRRVIIRILSGILILLAVAFGYLASSVCIAIVLSAFLAILADPAVRLLEKLQLPRSLAAGLVILLGVAGVGVALYASYDRLTALDDDLPRYVSQIREKIAPITAKIQRVQDNAGAMTAESQGKKVPEVRIRESSWPTYFLRGIGSISGALVLIGVVPFLTFFMLLGRDKLFFSMDAIFGRRVEVTTFMNRVSRMVTGYALGNLCIAAFLAAATSLVFWSVDLKPAVTLGIVCGVLNLIPFLGLVLALAIPVVAGIFQFESAGAFVVVAVAIVVLHLVAGNFLVPRFVGSRVKVGPVAATVGLLFWGWLWGVVGLLLAVPLTAFLKIVADSRPSWSHFSSLLAPDAQPAQLPAQVITAPVSEASPHIL